MDLIVVFCILFVFMLVLYCFCVATEFSVNKDLYKRGTLSFLAAAPWCLLRFLQTRWRHCHHPPSSGRQIILNMKRGTWIVSQSSTAPLVRKDTRVCSRMLRWMGALYMYFRRICRSLLLCGTEQTTLSLQVATHAKRHVERVLSLRSAEDTEYFSLQFLTFYCDV